jgi:DDE superfamily endonuclease
MKLICGRTKFIPRFRALTLHHNNFGVSPPPAPTTTRLSPSVTDAYAERLSVHDVDRVRALGDLNRFRQEFYDCLAARADGLFELADAVLCTDGPVRSLVGLSLAPEHRRGHGGLYDAINNGRIDCDRLRTALSGLPLPRAAGGRLVLAVDVSPWLRPDGATCPDRSFCHTYGRGKDEHRMVPASSRRWGPVELRGRCCSTR